SFDDLSTTRPRHVTTSLSRTSAAKRTPSLVTRPAPAQSVSACATKPSDSMPCAKTPPMPALLANSSSWWMGLKSPEAPGQRVGGICWLGPLTGGGSPWPTCPSWAKPFAFSTAAAPRSQPHQGHAAHDRHDVVVRVGDRRFANDERHRPALAGLL